MRFSVIIPLYNKAPYVAKAIQSVLLQSFVDYELVIIDDGSKDDSAEMAKKAIENRSNCHVIKQDNAGVSIARNNGVVASHGDFLCFLDADDWWNPFFLEEVDRLIAEFPDAGIYGTNYTIVNEAKHKTRVANIGVEEGFEKGYINYCQVYAKTLNMPLWTGAVCIPRPVFDEMQGFPKGVKLGEDFMLWIRIAMKYKVAFLDKALSYYNQDVDPSNRGVGKLLEPQYHMLWNLDFLEKEEKSNADYKQLIDCLRTYALLPYFVSKAYHEAAKMELEKVDWSKQSSQMQKQYNMPLPLLQMKCDFMKLGSQIKKILLSLI